MTTTMIHNILLLLLISTTLLINRVSCKPNVVFVLLDDVGVTDMFNNESVVPTPFLNSLLSKGVHFTQVNKYSSACYC